MASVNLTHSDPLTFILAGIPGLEAAHVWISIPFSTSYIIILLGNVMVLFVVFKEKTLHKPMYLLLCMLAFTDITKCTLIMPKALCIFWFNLKVITASGCFTEIFVLHTIAYMQSAILMTMAFDRYVAICNPLRYTTILTNERIAKIGLASLIRSAVFMLPLPLLLSRQPFCANHIVPNTHCEHLPVAMLSCGDITVNKKYGLLITIILMGSDLTLIVLSYCFIIRTILTISSKKAHKKALNTCTAHICVMLMYYCPIFFVSLTHQFGQSVVPHIHIILVDLYILIPSMFNPIIYGVKTQELRDKVGKYICRK